MTRLNLGELRDDPEPLGCDKAGASCALSIETGGPTCPVRAC